MGPSLYSIIQFTGPLQTSVVPWSGIWATWSLKFPPALTLRTSGPLETRGKSLSTMVIPGTGIGHPCCHFVSWKVRQGHQDAQLRSPGSKSDTGLDGAMKFSDSQSHNGGQGRIQKEQASDKGQLLYTSFHVHPTGPTSPYPP